MKCLHWKNMFQCPPVVATNQEKDYSNIMHYTLFILKINLSGKKNAGDSFWSIKTYKDLPALVIFYFLAKNETQEWKVE